MKIELDFTAFVLEGELFDTSVGNALTEALPLEIPLTSWGAELYGPVDRDFGEGRLQPEIPSGGLAYTNKGNYFCIFFGQTPAWPVEHVGAITGPFEQLDAANPEQVTIRKKNP
jgi:hypothetical protein